MFVEDFAVDDRHVAGRVDEGAGAAGLASAGRAAFVVDDPTVERVSSRSRERFDMGLVGQRLVERLVVVWVAVVVA
ncbi:MAG: hypothetical protein ACRDPC_16685 [Solirubrobacteraceae bacterium]